MDCCSQCFRQCDLDEQPLVEALEELHMLGMVRLSLLVFWWARLSIEKDRLYLLRQEVDIQAVEAHWDRTLAEALGPSHIVLQLDIGCSRRMGFGMLGHILLAALCSKATACG